MQSLGDGAPPPEDLAPLIDAHTMEDLDGDGVEELVLSSSWGGWNKVWPQAIYLSNGCRFSGVHFAAEQHRAMNRRRNGVRDIEFSSSDGCAGWQFTWTRMAYLRGRFREVAVEHCDLCEDSGPPAERPSNRCRRLGENGFLLTPRQ